MKQIYLGGLSVMLMSFMACASITHPKFSFFFVNKAKILRYTSELDPSTSMYKNDAIPTEYFGKVPVELTLRDMGRNAFKYGIFAEFLVHERNEQITVHEVALLYEGKEWPLSKQREVFIIPKRLLGHTVARYSTEDGGWYSQVNHINKKQERRLGTDTWVSIIPPTDLLKVFKKMGVAVKDIDSDTTDIFLRITYQLDDDEVITYTHKFILRIRELGYQSPWAD